MYRVITQSNEKNHDSPVKCPTTKSPCCRKMYHFYITEDLGKRRSFWTKYNYVFIEQRRGKRTVSPFAVTLIVKVYVSVRRPFEQSYSFTPLVSSRPTDTLVERGIHPFYNSLYSVNECLFSIIFTVNWISVYFTLLSQNIAIFRLCTSDGVCTYLLHPFPFKILKPSTELFTSRMNPEKTLR